MSGKQSSPNASTLISLAIAQRRALVAFHLETASFIVATTWMRSHRKRRRATPPGDGQRSSSVIVLTCNEIGVALAENLLETRDGRPVDRLGRG